MPFSNAWIVLFCSANSAPPVGWAPFAVRECQNPDMAVLVCVDDEVRETMSETSASSVGTQPPAFWVLNNRLDGPLYLSLEIQAQARSSVFVIRDGRPQLYFRFVDDRDFRHEYFALMSANTSAAGRAAALPSRTIFSRR